MIKKIEKLDMRKELRITGDRDAPVLPKLSNNDYISELWEAIQEPSWTFHEASYYVNNAVPGEKISHSTAKAIARTHFWLVKAYEKSTDLLVTDDLRLTPGDFMRFLWEKYRPVSLKVWALYHAYDKNEAPMFEIRPHLVKKRYLTAAKIVRDYFPTATTEELADFLLLLPAKAKDKKGTPLFLARKKSTLVDYIKSSDDLKKLSRGCRCSADHQTILHDGDDLIDIISEKIG